VYNFIFKTAFFLHLSAEKIGISGNRNKYRHGRSLGSNAEFLIAIFD